MKSFKEFLSEKYINSIKEWQQMAQLSVPLSPSILQEFERDISKAYHITDLKGFNRLIKLQGKRKDVACFTRASSGIASGAKTNGTILVQVSGKSSFYSDKDFMSRLDRNGIRWIGMYGDVDGSANNKESVIFVEFSRVMKKKIMDKYPIDDFDDMWVLLEDSMSGKEKAEFIKWYYDEAKKIMNSSFMKKVQNKMKKLHSSSGDYNNDEIFIHSIKIEDTNIVDKYSEGEEVTKEERKVEIAKLDSLGYNTKIITKKEVEKIGV